MKLPGYILCLIPLLPVGIARAETAIWSDGFETNAAKRWTSTGEWHIGSPSSGPAVNNIGYRTHSSTNCASTQGYALSKDARLVCTNYNGASFLTIPAGNQFPRLRFWHWFNFANALGYVEISTDGTNWSQLSPTYEMNYSGAFINSSGVWSRPSIDLSAYAGQSVQIAFHFTCGCCTGNGLGWYVDDIEVDKDLPILNPPEGFEFDPKMTDWAVDFGTWEIGKPTSGPNAAHSGTNCAGTVLGGNYANAADTRLLSPLILVPPSGSPRLNFWQWYSFNNALGFVEIHNGVTNVTVVTNTVTITNAVANGLNTNIYQLFGAAISGYATPLYWNQTIGGWTNASKALGVVNDLNYGFYFDAGSAPLSSVGVPYSDYRANSVLPSPRSAAETNFLSLQGTTWNASSGAVDNPVGYFGTNYTYTYTTNTTVSTNTQGGWTQLSPTYLNLVSGAWTNTTLDLSNYAGQVVQLGFHFTSGDCCGVSSGWYVDDINLLTTPTLTVPTNQIISSGQTPTFSLSATNSREPSSTFTFGLALSSPNVEVATNGLVFWTNTAAPPGTYPIYVKVTDNSSISATNNFSVTVLALPSQLTLTNIATSTNGGGSFNFSVNTPWTNSTWVVVATTNLSDAPTNWLPIYTNQTGPGGTAIYTDLLSTNFLRRYYRAVFP